MPLIDLKRTPKDKQEDAQEYAQEAASTATSQPDYGYGLQIHLEAEELEKLGIKDLPQVGDEYHLHAIAKVKGVNERDSGARKESEVDLQITMMEIKHGSEMSEENDSVGEKEAESAENMAVGGRAKTMMHNAYRGGR